MALTKHGTENDIFQVWSYKQKNADFEKDKPVKMSPSQGERGEGKKWYPPHIIQHASTNKHKMDEVKKQFVDEICAPRKKIDTSTWPHPWWLYYNNKMKGKSNAGTIFSFWRYFLFFYHLQILRCWAPPNSPPSCSFLKPLGSYLHVYLPFPSYLFPSSVLRSLFSPSIPKFEYKCKSYFRTKGVSINRCNNVECDRYVIDTIFQPRAAGRKSGPVANTRE